jgi:hypothetical protein
MKLPLRKDTAQSIAARLLRDASKVELSHSTPVTGESFIVHPVTVERQIMRLRRWARQLYQPIA